VKAFVLFAASALTCALPAHAANDGQMWEMTIQMNMAGVPAGMMQPRTQQVCQAKDFRNATGDKNQRCTISDLKDTPSRVTYNIRCEGKPPTTGKAEFNFQNGRQKMDGTMQLSTSDGDMTMKMSGRNLGSACDPQQNKTAQDEKVAAATRQMESLQRQGDDAQIMGCNDGLAKMQPLGFGTPGNCRIFQDSNCKALERTSPAVKSACNEKIGQFCQRYQTRDGLEKIAASGGTADHAAKLCAVPLAKVRANLCPAAVKDNALMFIAHQCPDEAKVIAQKQCAGRTFTSMDEKYGQFCGAYRGRLASNKGEDSGSGGDAAPATQSRSRTTVQPAAGAAKAPSAPTAQDAAQDAVKEGIGKLKGLFGR
jgi:hypothetical protein